MYSRRKGSYGVAVDGSYDIIFTFFVYYLDPFRTEFIGFVLEQMSNSGLSIKVILYDHCLTYGLGYQ